MADEVKMESMALHCAHLILDHFIGFLSAIAGSPVVVFQPGAPKVLSSAQPRVYDISPLPFKSCLNLASVFSENPVCAFDSICEHVFAGVGSIFSLVSFLVLLQFAPLWSVLWRSCCF